MGDPLCCDLAGCDRLLSAVDAVEDLGVTISLTLISVVFIPRLLFAFLLDSALHSKEVNFYCIDLILLLLSGVLDSRG